MVDGGPFVGEVVTVPTSLDAVVLEKTWIVGTGKFPFDRPVLGVPNNFEGVPDFILDGVPIYKISYFQTSDAYHLESLNSPYTVVLNPVSLE